MLLDDNNMIYCLFVDIGEIYKFFCCPDADIVGNSKNEEGQEGGIRQIRISVSTKQNFQFFPSDSPPTLWHMYVLICDKIRQNLEIL